MDQMKLQKLVYLAHGWNLAINGEPLVKDTIEAWDGGPVMRMIWNHFRDFGYNEEHLLEDKITSKAFKADLSESERDIIDHTWTKYGGYSGLRLSGMTHRPRTPWSNAYFGAGRGRNSALSQDEIQQHFIELALNGRSQKA